MVSSDESPKVIFDIVNKRILDDDDIHGYVDEIKITIVMRKG